MTGQVGDDVAGKACQPPAWCRSTRAAVLSVGQRQRLCLARARALTVDPIVLLLDQPTSALDQPSRSVVEHSVAGLRGTRTVLLVSHDRAQVDRLCGTTVELGPPAGDCDDDPACVPVAERALS